MSDFMNLRDWCSVVLENPEAQKLKAFLKKENIKYEPSEYGNKTHFSVYVNVSELKKCSDFLETL